MYKQGFSHNSQELYTALIASSIWNVAATKSGSEPIPLSDFLIYSGSSELDSEPQTLDEMMEAGAGMGGIRIECKNS